MLMFILDNKVDFEQKHDMVDDYEIQPPRHGIMDINSAKLMINNNAILTI